MKKVWEMHVVDCAEKLCSLIGRRIDVRRSRDGAPAGERRGMRGVELVVKSTPYASFAGARVEEVGLTTVRPYASERMSESREAAAARVETPLARETPLGAKILTDDGELLCVSLLLEPISKSGCARLLAAISGYQRNTPDWLSAVIVP